MIALRLVLDTNIVVSAALKPDGLQRTVVVLALTKPARWYVTEAILDEYREVLARPELKIRSARNSCSSSESGRISSVLPVRFTWRQTRTTTFSSSAQTRRGPTIS